MGNSTTQLIEIALLVDGCKVHAAKTVLLEVIEIHEKCFPATVQPSVVVEAKTHFHTTYFKLHPFGEKIKMKFSAAPAILSPLLPHMSSPKA